MNKKYVVHLSASEREETKALLHRGRMNARTLTRARILLKAAEGWDDARIAATLDTSLATVGRVRQRFASGGLSTVLTDKPQPGRPRVLGAAQAAHLIAVACTPAPEGHDHWTVRLLADKAVELGFVAAISPETVRQLLQKTS